MKASLQYTFATNYEFRCSLLDFSEPTDIVLLLNALGPVGSLTWKERKKHLPIFTLLFNDDSDIVNLCRSRVNITIICKHMDDLKEIYNQKAIRQIQDFNILLVLTKWKKVVAVPPGLLNKKFGSPKTPIDSMGASEWCESSANIDGLGINVRFMSNGWDTVIPFWQPLLVAKTFMFTKGNTEGVRATVEYMHLHNTMTAHRTAITIAGGKRYWWSNDVVFGFTVHMGYRLYAHVAILS